MDDLGGALCLPRLTFVPLGGTREACIRAGGEGGRKNKEIKEEGEEKSRYNGEKRKERKRRK